MSENMKPTTLNTHSNKCSNPIVGGEIANGTGAVKMSFKSNKLKDTFCAREQMKAVNEAVKMEDTVTILEQYVNDLDDSIDKPNVVKILKSLYTEAINI